MLYHIADFDFVSIDLDHGETPISVSARGSLRLGQGQVTRYAKGEITRLAECPDARFSPSKKVMEGHLWMDLLGAI